MIQLKDTGDYSLIETRNQTKILTLNGKAFAWIHAGEIGEMLVATHRKHATDHILAIGKYRLYSVKDEPGLTDLLHLELFVGDGKWQGYLLLTGLPKGKNTRKVIVPTRELITQSMT